MFICSFLVWKNACLNYREFDLEDDLVGTPCMVFIGPVFHNTNKICLKRVGLCRYEWVGKEMGWFAEDIVSTVSPRGHFAISISPRQKNFLSVWRNVEFVSCKISPATHLIRILCTPCQWSKRVKILSKRTGIGCLPDAQMKLVCTVYL